VAQPPYPYGTPHDPANQPPSDPFQTAAGYPPPFPDPAYPDPAYHPATQPAQYPPTQPYHPGQQGYQAGQYPVYPPTPSYPEYPTNPTQPRRGATVAIIVVVALLVLVVSGGVAAAYLLPKNHNAAAGSSQSPGVTNSPTQASPTPASPSPAPGPTHTGDLRALLVAAPSGAKACPKEEGTNGSLSLDQAANLSNDPNQRRSELQKYSFTGGAVSCWVASDQTVVDIRLYQFDSTDDGLGFFNADIGGTTPGYSSDNITDVAGLPGAKSFADPTKDSNGYYRVISIGLRGDVVLVVALAQVQELKVPVAEQLLTQEAQKL
jgi:hypothetical protein